MYYNREKLEENAMNKHSLIYFSYLVSALIIFFVVNSLTGILVFAVRSAISPLTQDTLFPLTYSLAIASFLVTIYWYRDKGLTGFPYAIGVPFFWIILFEILWQNSFLLFGTFTDDVLSEIILSSWFMIGVISYPTWNIDKFTLWVFLMFSAGWTAWILARYPQMPSLSGYVFNISLKIGAFLAIMLMVKPRKKQRIQHSPISITE